MFSDSLVTASFNESNSDGYLDSDHSTQHGSRSGVGESVCYDLGSGTTSSVIDTVASVSGTVNYMVHPLKLTKHIYIRCKIVFHLSIIQTGVDLKT